MMKNKCKTDWTVRPNPEGRIVRKPEGRIFDLERKFNRKAEIIIVTISAQYID